MVATLERPEVASIKATYHNPDTKTEIAFPKDVLTSNPHVRRLVELCSQALEKSRIQVYENGGEPYVPAAKRFDPKTKERIDVHYFKVDPITGIRITEIPANRVMTIPMHIIGDDGQTIVPIREVNDRKRKIFGYCQIDEQGKAVMDTDGETPKLISVQPDQIRQRKTIDIVSGDELTALDERDILKEEMADVVASHFKDLIEDPGDSEEKDAQWANAEVAPTIIGLITDKNAYIEGVQKSHALNIVSAALQIARNPNTKIKIVSGFGASEKEASNAYVGNAIPALEMADRIRIKQAEGRIALTNAPVVELVFATEAGVEANFKDDKEGADSVRARMTSNMDYVAQFAQQLYPDVAVVFNQDIPWSELSPQTLAVIGYNASIIRNSPSDSVQKTLDELVNSGHTKGTNGSTKETAARYAAIHPPVWGINPDYVPTKYLVKDVPGDVVIRIGPRTESKFDAMIMAIKDTANREGFIEHVLEEARTGNLVTEVAEQIVTSAETYQAEEVLTMVLETAGIGKHGPTYFTYGYDKPVGHPIDETVRELREEAANITGTDLPSVTRRNILLARIYDLEAIASARNRLVQAA